MTATALRITGAEAASIARHVAIYVKPGRNWVEVQAMRECGHGCKLHTRKQGAVTQYRLFHSATYGCALGRAPETREVPVSVAPSAVSS